MSYTRFASKRRYTYGTSGLYSWWDARENKIALLSSGSDCITFVEREDVLEFIMSLLDMSGVHLSKEDIRKIAKELEVELRGDEDED